MISNVFTVTSLAVLFYGLSFSGGSDPTAISATVCSGGVNKTCTDLDMHSFCNTNRCKCIAGYKENTTNTSTCIQVFGTTCTGSTDCPAESNTHCMGTTQAKTCTCTQNFTSSNGICTAKANIANNNQNQIASQVAISSIDCTVAGNKTCTDADKNSLCVAARCKCRAGYKENATNTSTCIQVLGSTCQAQNECPVESNTDCSGTPSKTCTCKQNFASSSGICKQDSAAVSTRFTVVSIGASMAVFIFLQKMY